MKNTSAKSKVRRSRETRIVSDTRDIFVFGKDTRVVEHARLTAVFVDIWQWQLERVPTVPTKPSGALYLNADINKSRPHSYIFVYESSSAVVS